AQWQQRSSEWLQGAGVDLVHQLHPPECGRRANRSGARIDERAIYPWPAVAAAKFALDADDLAGLWSEVGEVGPRQLELGGVASSRRGGDDLGSLQLEVLALR